MNSNYENNKYIDDKVNRAVQWGIKFAFSHTQMATEYMQKLIDAYNSSLMMERDWQKLLHSNDASSKIRPDYFQTSLKLFVIKVSSLELTRSTCLEYIGGLDEDKLGELVNQVKIAAQAIMPDFDNFVQETRDVNIKQEILNFFGEPVLESAYSELFELYIQSLSEDEKHKLATCNTKNALLDNVRNTRRIGEDGFEQIYELKIESIKRDGFASTDIPTITSAIEKSSIIAANELKKLDIANQMDPHYRFV